ETRKKYAALFVAQLETLNKEK
ncbi:hypothetical protein LCGC14_2587910, partial [marine sediment metagenome]